MSQTIETTDLYRDLADDVAFAPEVIGSSPTAEQWLEVMYGIRPGHSSPTTSGVTESCLAGADEWLYRLFGLRPTTSRG